MMLDVRVQSVDGEKALISFNGKPWLEASLPLHQEFLFQAIRHAAADAGVDSHAFLIQCLPVSGTKTLPQQLKKEKPKSRPIADLLAELGL